MDCVKRDAAQEARVLATFWTAPLTRNEMALLRQKAGWFDVRLMTPVARTERLAYAFTLQTRVMIRRYLDDAPPGVTVNGHATDWNPIKAGDVFVPAHDWSGKQIDTHRRKIAALIRARQWLDESGIPYQFAVKCALDLFYFKKSYLRQHRTLPCPSMMNGEAMRAEIVVKWVEQLAAQIQASDDPRFVIVGEATEEQVVHEKWLLDQIERRAKPEYALRTFISKGLVRAEIAATRFEGAPA